jgi:hypothetical protein
MYRHLWTAGKNKYRRLMTITSNHDMGRRKNMNIKYRQGQIPSTRNTRQIEA